LFLLHGEENSKSEILLYLIFSGPLEVILTLFYTPGDTGDPLAFLHRYGNLTILEFSSQLVKILVPYGGGGGRAACNGGWGQSDDS
jgi:hypothetical protein